jgi:hypothetical protein
MQQAPIRNVGQTNKEAEAENVALASRRCCQSKKSKLSLFPMIRGAVSRYARARADAGRYLHLEKNPAHPTLHQGQKQYEPLVGLS